MIYLFFAHSRAGIVEKPVQALALRRIRDTAALRW
jgi:hypothetical protein